MRRIVRRFLTKEQEWLCALCVNDLRLSNKTVAFLCMPGVHYFPLFQISGNTNESPFQPNF